MTEYHDNVFSIDTREKLPRTYSTAPIPDTLQVINILNQRRNQIQDLICIWIERDGNPDPKFMMTPMTSVQRQGMLHYTDRSICDFIAGQEWDEE